MQYASIALFLSEKLNFKKGEASAYDKIAFYYGNKDNYSEALKNHLQALKISEEIGDKKEIAWAYNNIASVYLSQNNYSEALKNSSKALKIQEEIGGNKKRLAYYYGNTGVIYSEEGNHSQKLGDTAMANSYYSEARKNYITTIKIFEELGDKQGIASARYYIGEMYLYQKNYPEALKNYFASSKLFQQLEESQNVSIAYVAIGKVLIKQKKYSEALEYLNNGASLSKESKQKYFLKEMYSGLSETYEKLGQHMKALEYYKLYSDIKDSMSGGDMATKIAKLQNQYLAEQEEKIRKVEGAKKESEHIAEVKQQKIIIYSVSAGLILMLTLAFFIFRGYKQKQKANLLLADKNKIIQEKNEDITDSINYAKRIQQAKLPSKEIIYYALPDSFVLFKPKDIVSGDFYYFHKNDKAVFIASADCTGHGVPGAFMSMIGSEKLDDALAHSADTSKILSHLNKGIKVSLHQTDSNESTRDGMDIALCSVDTDARVVKYAGANRPLWIIRNGQTVVEEIKATKKAIGGFTEDNQHFDSHEIKLQQGDTFYLSTDGYADTFSGQDGKKLMTKRFKEILLDIQTKTMQEQEKYLDDFIENWKAGTEQVDDILVIGVRL
ncbi:MAG: tetratricopeptide repeat protein [Bacteroidetes bacterium]|nr:tetratricopeptide repeat protein [Bacteroidota bacterium]